jgi:hypothetical protein
MANEWHRDDEPGGDYVIRDSTGHEVARGRHFVMADHERNARLIENAELMARMIVALSERYDSPCSLAGVFLEDFVKRIEG